MIPKVEIGPGLEALAIALDGFGPPAVFVGMVFEAVDGQPGFAAGQSVELAVDAVASARFVQEAGIFGQEKRIGADQACRAEVFGASGPHQVVKLPAPLEGSIHKEQIARWGQIRRLL